jgi:hypothetical protein
MHPIFKSKLFAEPIFKSKLFAEPIFKSKLFAEPIFKSKLFAEQIECSTMRGQFQFMVFIYFILYLEFDLAL